MGLQTILIGGKTFQLDNVAGTWSQLYYLTPDQNSQQVTTSSRTAYPGILGASIAIAIFADPDLIQCAGSQDSWLYSVANDVWQAYQIQRVSSGNDIGTQIGPDNVESVNAGIAVKS